MKFDRYIHRALLPILLIGWGWLLAACSDHTDPTEDQPEPQTGSMLRIGSLTRSDSSTDPFEGGAEVKLFLVPQGADAKEPGVVKKDDSSGDIIWNGNPLMVKPGADYSIFGFLPAAVTEEASAVTVDEANSLATMTIHDLPAVTSQDLCVIIGVKEGRLSANESVTPGTFAYHAPENTAEDYYVSLLADHLYAGVTFKFYIDPTYDALRTIKLKKVEMKSTSKMMNVTIPLNMNNEGNNPIGTPTYTATETAQADVTLYQSQQSQGETLTLATANTPLTFTAYFSPGVQTGLSIVSTYDVYDKDGHLLSENRQAENSLAAPLAGVLRGQKGIITLTVNPTYLYILSNWDINNPEFVITN